MFAALPPDLIAAIFGAIQPNHDAQRRAAQQAMAANEERRKAEARMGFVINGECIDVTDEKQLNAF